MEIQEQGKGPLGWMWRQALPESAAYKFYLQSKIIVHKAIYNNSRVDENSHCLSVCTNVFSTGHMLRIIILINSKSLTWYVGEGWFLKSSEIPWSRTSHTARLAYRLRMRGWKNGLEVRIPGCFSRWPGFNPQDPQGGLQPTVSPDLGIKHPLLASRHQARM